MAAEPEPARPMPERTRPSLRFSLVLLLCAVAWSVCTVLIQFRDLPDEFYTEQIAVEQHVRMLAGTAGAPAQYRVLSAYGAELAVQSVRALGSRDPIGTGFLLFRLLQNGAVFLLAGWYYRRLGIGPAGALIGVSLLAWAFTHSLHGADLMLSRYMEVSLFLCAALCIVANRPMWVVVVAAAAALNRETGVLLAAMLAGSAAVVAAGGADRQRGMAATGLSLAAYALMAVGLRMAFVQQPPAALVPGVGLLAANVRNWESWIQLFSVVSVLPVVALATFRRWPDALRGICAGLVPAWFLWQFVAARTVEGSLYLVPLAVVFIPGALLSAATASVEPDA